MSQPRIPAAVLQEQLLTIIDVSPSLVGLFDADRHLVFLNPAGRRLLGIEPHASLSDLRLESLYTADAGREVLAEGLPTTLRVGRWSGETTLRDPLGAPIPAWHVLVAHRSADGELAFLSVVIQDLSEWKGTEAALGERMKELRTLYGVSRALSQPNQSMESRLDQVASLLPSGWTDPTRTEAQIRWGDRSFRSDGYAETRWMQRASIFTQGQNVGEVCVAVRDPGGESPGWSGPFLEEEQELIDAVAIAIAEAIERDRMQTELLQGQKIETIGRLAGGVAHDFNNLLAVIRGHAEIVLESLPGDDPAREDLARILRTTERGSTLTNQLLAFSRKQVLQERLLDLREAVVEIEPMLRRLIPTRIDLSVEFRGRGGHIRVDAAKLDQVILNLVVNAVDAIHGEGQITLRVEPRSLEAEPSGAIVWKTEPGPYVQLSVVDTGAGIPDNALGKIFEPFFTTKPAGRGTGLGLSMVYGFVKQSGGHILVDSAPNQGTSVRLLFPAVSPEHPEAGPAPSEPESTGPARQDPEGSGEAATLLLVEDDGAVRRVLRRTLSGMGHTVLEAENGRRALRLVERHRSEIDVVLADVVMPGMGGTELLERLHEVSPELPVVLMSGYSRDELTLDIRALAMDFLEKPFTRSEVERVIRSALGRTG
jgi:signal transduction histidine kinase/CheY-like chemotaxis protein